MNNPTTHPTRQRPSERLAIVAALDAIEVGDYALVGEILLGALEDGAYVVRARCRFCGAGYEWAGLRDHHELVAHDHDHLDHHDHAVHLDEEEARAA